MTSGVIRGQSLNGDFLTAGQKLGSNFSAGRLNLTFVDVDGPSGPDGYYRFLFPSENLNDLLLGSWVSSNPFRSGNKCSFECQRKTLTFVRSRAFCLSRDQWSMCWIRANAWR